MRQEHQSQDGVSGDQKTKASGCLPWHLLETLKGRTLTTLAQNKEFAILDVSPYRVKLRRRETKTTAFVERLEFEKTYTALTETGSLHIGDIRGFSARGSSYIAAILTQLPDVVWDGKRLGLHAPAARPQPSPQTVRPPASPDPVKSISFDAGWAEQSPDVLECWRKLDRRAQKDIIALALSDTAMLVRNLASCESPLEQILAAHLLSAGRMMSLVHDFTLEPQYEVQTSEGLYRVDILVKGEIDGKPVSLAVECDGYTFHDRTQEQAARDKKRDRALKREGHEVIHFAGSEIRDDPEECALDVFRLMLSLAGRTEGAVTS